MQSNGAAPQGRADAKLLDSLIPGAEIKFGTMMDVIESYEKARGSPLFVDTNERNKTKAFFLSCAGESTPKENAIQIIEMLREEADRTHAEKKISSNSVQETSSDEKENKPTQPKPQQSKPPSSFTDLRQRRRTSSGYRVKGPNDSSSSGSDSDGSDARVEDSLTKGSTARKSLSAAPLTINTDQTVTPASPRRPLTSQGVAFPGGSILSPTAPPTAFRGSGIPRSVRRSDPSRPNHTHRPSSSTSHHPPSAYATPQKSSHRTRSGSAGESSRSGLTQATPPGSFGMGVPYSTGVGGFSRPGPPRSNSATDKARRGSSEIVRMSSPSQQTSSPSKKAYPGLRRSQPSRSKTDLGSDSHIAFPKSDATTSNNSTAPGSPDLNSLKLTDDQSLLEDVTLPSRAHGSGPDAVRSRYSSTEDETFEAELVQAEADISRMGRGSIADATMDLSVDLEGLGNELEDGLIRNGEYGMPPLLHMNSGVDYGNGVGARRRKISGERMKRLSSGFTAPSLVSIEKLSQLEGENQGLQSKTRALEEKLTAQENDTEAMQGRLLDMERNLKDETSEKRRLERELRQKDRENQTALNELENKLSQTQEQLRDLRMAHASAGTSNAKLKDEVQDLSRAIRDKEDEISALVTELNELKEDKGALSRDLADIHTRFEQSQKQVSNLRQANREMSLQLEQQQELHETIGTLNHEVADLRLRLNHSHVRGSTETAALSPAARTENDVPEGKRSLADDMGGALEDDDDETEPGQVAQDASSGQGMTTIYHTTTVRRVMRPRTVNSDSKQQDQAGPSNPSEQIFEEIEREYADAGISTDPLPERLDACTQTDESHGTTLPPYTPRSDDQLVAEALAKLHPKLEIDEHPQTDQDTLQSVAGNAQAYAELSVNAGIRCQVIENALRDRQGRVVAKVGQDEMNKAMICRDTGPRSKTEAVATKPWILAVVMIVPAILVGLLVAMFKGSPAQRDSLAAYLLTHDMANLGFDQPLYLPGSINRRLLSGGASVVTGKVPM